ncbi:MAG: hypothetical protein WCK41_05555 [Actinomycetes bacterium]
MTSTLVTATKAQTRLPIRLRHVATVVAIGGVVFVIRKRLLDRDAQQFAQRYPT